MLWTLFFQKHTKLLLKSESGIEVVAQPQFDVESMEKGQDWVIKADVTKPEVKLGAYKDLEVTVEATKGMTDAEVDARWAWA